MLRRLPPLATLWCLALVSGLANAQGAPRLNWYPAEPELYSRFEVRLDATCPGNPFDPRDVDFSAQFRTPSGRSLSVPGFYYEPYSRLLSRNQNGKDEEALVSADIGSWRVRYCPTEVGTHRFRALLRCKGQPDRAWEGTLNAVASRRRGFVRVEPSTRRYFEFDDRTPMFPLGECCCWGGPLGTFSYDDWFEKHRSAGMNYGRIWMSPWAFGIESEPKTLRNYRLDRAWALDYVLELAEKSGIYLMICFDYHGMLKTRKDRWGKNDNWPKHPYHKANGGPCRKPGDFFTQPEAKRLYKDRLRYIVARWGYSTHVFAWEFWNEVDLTYSEPGVTAQAVERWHEDMSVYLKQIDANRHMITTSFFDDEAAAPVWRLPAIDLTQSHSYNKPDPAKALTAVTDLMYARYRKPTFVGEYGVDSGGSKGVRAKDPLGNALRQALWATTLSGSAGAAMPWWWDNYIHPEGLYIVWRTLTEFLEGEPIGSPQIAPARIDTTPAEAGKPKPIADAPAFRVRLLPQTDRKHGIRPVTVLLAQGDPATRRGAYHAFLYPETDVKRRDQVTIKAWFGDKAEVKLRVNSVAQGAVILILVDGVARYTHHLRDKDHKAMVSKEYDRTLSVPVPEGFHEVKVANRGRGWAYLDWIDVSQVRPATGLDPPPRLRAYGLASRDRAWLWLLSPEATWPKRPSREAMGTRVVVCDMQNGPYAVEWWDPASGTVLGKARIEARAGRLELHPPAFISDMAAKAARIAP